MVRAREILRNADGSINRQFQEVIRASQTVQIGPDPRDLQDDGTPAHHSQSTQIDGRYLAFESKGVGVAVEIPHRLGRVPMGFLETSKRDPGGIVGVPNDQAVNRSWTMTKIYLVPQTPAGTKHSVLVF